ncbi:hypothetical protein D3C81_2012510 [compost metagenome]
MGKQMVRRNGFMRQLPPGHCAGSQMAAQHRARLQLLGTDSTGGQMGLIHCFALNMR